MRVNHLLSKYIPLIDILPIDNKPITKPSDASLLVTSPEEIQKNLEQWRKYNQRIHIIV